MPIGKKPKAEQVKAFLSGGLARPEEPEPSKEGSKDSGKEKPVIVRLPPRLSELVAKALKISREDNPKQSQHQWILAALTREAKRQITTYEQGAESE
jgi:hypothetical protein